MNKEVETNSRPLVSNRLVSSEKKLQEKLWNSNFILLLQGQLVSVFGDSVYDVAFRFWILTTTGSTALMGIFMAVIVSIIVGICGCFLILQLIQLYLILFQNIN